MNTNELKLKLMDIAGAGWAVTLTLADKQAEINASRNVGQSYVYISRRVPDDGYEIDAMVAELTALCGHVDLLGK